MAWCHGEEQGGLSPDAKGSIGPGLICWTSVASYAKMPPVGSLLDQLCSFILKSIRSSS